MNVLKNDYKNLELNFNKQEQLCRNLETTNVNLSAEKLQFELRLSCEKEALSANEERLSKILIQKQEIEQQVFSIICYYIFSKHYF